jgi:hypothetical protein
MGWCSREVTEADIEYRELIRASVASPSKELRDAATKTIKESD